MDFRYGCGKFSETSNECQGNEMKEHMGIKESIIFIIKESKMLIPYAIVLLLIILLFFYLIIWN